MSRPACAIVNLGALKNNYLIAKEMTNGYIVAVLKANAYGHGATACAHALSDIADAFAVACIEEALVLRHAGIKNTILLLEGFFHSSELKLINQYYLDSVIHCQEQLDILKQYPAPCKLKIWLKMDTGMGRLGFLPQDYLSAWKQIKQLNNVSDIVLMSHLSCADMPQHPQNEIQYQCFKKYTKDLHEPISLYNSAGLITAATATNSRLTALHWSRIGLMLYGISPFTQAHPIEKKLQPVMQLYASLISIKLIPKGGYVGYGAAWCAKKKTRLGIVALGYADGYIRQLGAQTPVIVHGKRTTLIGIISMDMLAIDLTHIPEALLNDKVIFWGGKTSYQCVK